MPGENASMAEHELWRGERAERRRVMEEMEDDRAARERHVMRDSGGDEEYRRRLAEQRDETADHRGRGPRGYRRSDARILEDVNEQLTDDPRLDASGLEVTVDGGEVTLSGTVDSREAKRRAEDIAESVSGVAYVVNRLRPRQGGTPG
jgi:osmotically-inducible protein OsmY